MCDPTSKGHQAASDLDRATFDFGNKTRKMPNTSSRHSGINSQKLKFETWKTLSVAPQAKGTALVRTIGDEGTPLQTSLHRRANMSFVEMIPVASHPTWHSRRLVYRHSAFLAQRHENPEVYSSTSKQVDDQASHSTHEHM